LAPHSWATHYTLGAALRKTPGHREEALAAARKALELAPDAADPHVLVGLAYADFGDARTEEQYYRQALAIQPDHAYGQSNLSALRLRNGKFAEAMHGFQAAATSKPQETVFHRNIAATVLGSLLKRGYMVALVAVFVTGIVLAMMTSGSVSGSSGTATPPSADWPIRLGLALAILAAWGALFTIKLRPLTRYLRGHLRRALFASLRTARAGLPVGGWLLSQLCVLDALLNPTLSSLDQKDLGVWAIAAIIVGNLLGRLVGRFSRPKAN
jgi:tetratricopeptide (TPR) repeat protein